MEIVKRSLKKMKSFLMAETENIAYQNRFLLGQMMVNLNKGKSFNSIQDAEFKVFSQWGDDGIIQYLINNIDIQNKYFIEFGVENYVESNTRFLLMNNNWSGLVMDGDIKNIDYIKKDEIYWKYDLKAKCEFITAENINQILSQEGISGNIGLLHIDIDGNDYWIWKAIENLDPDIVIIEYNSVFGIEKAITIPYKPNFYRVTAHSSTLYAGASLLALCDLAKEKGLHFIGCNSAGNNAYFIKGEKNKCFKVLKPEEGYVKSKFREARNNNGDLLFIEGNERIKILKGLQIFNTRINKIEVI
jgi:hypothetical protein